MAAVTYKCPFCGGGLQFDPETQTYECEYCLSRIAQAELDQLPPVQSSESNKTHAAASAVVYHCPSCGGEIITDDTTAATFCYYCHNPVMLAGRLEGNYLPDYVLPFTIDKDQAKAMFSQWIRKMKYIPKAFYTPDQIEKLVGVYFPYWLYSCQAGGELEGEATKRRIWTTGNTRYTETQRFGIRRAGYTNINYLTRNALQKANKQLVEGVLPFNMKDLKPFHLGYLSGFWAEKRDVEKADLCSEVEKEIYDFVADSLKSGLGQYHSTNISVCRGEISNSDWRYALMPVWTLTYRDTKKNKLYYFALNGQTGKICGELPVDYVRLMILFSSIFFSLLILLLIGGYMI